MFYKLFSDLITLNLDNPLTELAVVEAKKHFSVGHRVFRNFVVANNSIDRRDELPAK